MSDYKIRKDKPSRKAEQSVEAQRIAEQHKRLRDEYYARQKVRQEREAGN